nr:SRPBCC family protein [uncultured Microbacterium sp.]
MAKNVRTMNCRPEDVFRVLGDGWLYPAWVVGASRMRDVDDTWPQKGAELHHSVGVWPALLDDTTVVEEWSPPHRMVMRAKGWPIGEARVTLRVRAFGEGTMVRIDEEPVNGPATLLPSLITTPLLRWRNSETLQRLAFLAEGRAD